MCDQTSVGLENPKVIPQSTFWIIFIIVYGHAIINDHKRSVWESGVWLPLPTPVVRALLARPADDRWHEGRGAAELSAAVSLSARGL